MSTTKKILVPTDFSEPSDLALKKAIEIATKENAEIYLLHVVDEAVRQCVVDYCLDNAVVEQLQQNQEKAAREKLDKEVQEIVANQKINIVYDIQHGKPSDVIIQEQQNKGIDLIVIASHGRTGLKKVMLGSVAEKVARHAECTILLVK